MGKRQKRVKNDQKRAGLVSDSCASNASTTASDQASLQSTAVEPEIVMIGTDLPTETIVLGKRQSVHGLFLQTRNRRVNKEHKGQKRVALATVTCASLSTSGDIEAAQLPFVLDNPPDAPNELGIDAASPTTSLIAHVEVTPIASAWAN